MQTEITLKPFYKNVLSWNKVAGNSITDSSLIGLYTSLVEEELNEIFHSIETNDQVEFIDGLVDSLVVGSFLYALKKQSNFSNHKESFVIVDVKDTVKKLEMFVKEKQISENIDLIISYLESIAYTIRENVDVVAACNEVMSSNWSKFPLTSEVTPENDASLIESQGRYTGITFKSIFDDKGDSRYIFYSDKGKIVKPSTFREPKLAQFIPNDWTYDQK